MNAPVVPDIDVLHGRAADLLRRIEALGTDTPATVGSGPLEAMVAALCGEATTLPPALARAMLPDLERLLHALDAAAGRMAEQEKAAAPLDSALKVGRARRAAAAYDAASARKRRGF